MNKQQLVDRIAAQADISKAAADRVISAFTDAVKEELKSGGSLTLVGFGTFSVNQRSSRLGRNPKTGETITIAASKVPTFKPGTGLKSAVN